jgi:hypothetical protein
MENVDLQLVEWVRRWQAVAPKLAELRRQELPLVDTKQALLNLADAFESCRLHTVSHRPLVWSPNKHSFDGFSSSGCSYRRSNSA